MIFIDFIGPRAAFDAAEKSISQAAAAVLRTAVASVVVRRVVIEPESADVEIWVELSSEEQLVRHGRTLAARISDAVREATSANVWVMFKIVPLSHAFLNGEPRGRGLPSFE